MGFICAYACATNHPGATKAKQGGVEMPVPTTFREIPTKNAAQPHVNYTTVPKPMGGPAIQTVLSS